MITIIFLWLTVILFSFYFAGHLFDLVANVPNWKSGEIADVEKYRNFYSQASPKSFFALLVLGTPAVSLITLGLVWQSAGLSLHFLAATFILSVIVLVFTLKHFLPINKYIFTSATYDQVELKKVVSKWISADYFRLLLIGAGMLTAIGGLNEYLKHLQ